MIKKNRKTCKEKNLTDRCDGKYSEDVKSINLLVNEDKSLAKNSDSVLKAVNIDAYGKQPTPTSNRTETFIKSNSITKVHPKRSSSFVEFVKNRLHTMSTSVSSGLHSNLSSGSFSVPWPNSSTDYELHEVIGVGATAVVHAAICKPRNEKCAIKRINLEKWNTSMDELLKEIQAMSSCHHDNVVTYHTSFVVDEELWLVLRLLEGGSLLDIIKHKMRISNCKHGVFDEATIATVLKEVLKGLEYFHSNGQIHRDIKAGNILLGEDGTVQIADFGVSAWLATGRDLSRQKVRHTFVGTPCWMAPEVMEQDHGYDFKADIWSFGITAIEMATGTAPYHKFPPMKVLMLTLQNEPPTLDTSADLKDQYKVYGRSFRKMISECLQKDPKKRPSASELLKNSFFKKARDRKFLQQTLVSVGPSLETRVEKASKKHGALGRLHLTGSGEWVWSSDEEESSDDDKNREVNNDAKPFNNIINHHSSSSDEADVDGGITIEKQNDVNVAEDEKPPINLVLRLRNANGELNDIRFEYALKKDTYIGIAQELHSAGLIEDKDVSVIATNLKKLIESQGALKSVTFPLILNKTDIVVDEKSLVGFAQISIIDDQC